MVHIQKLLRQAPQPFQEIRFIKCILHLTHISLLAKSQELQISKMSIKHRSDEAVILQKHESKVIRVYFTIDSIDKRLFSIR